MTKGVLVTGCFTSLVHDGFLSRSVFVLVRLVRSPCRRSGTTCHLREGAQEQLFAGRDQVRCGVVPRLAEMLQGVDVIACVAVRCACCEIFSLLRNSFRHHQEVFFVLRIMAS